MGRPFAEIQKSSWLDASSDFTGVADRQLGKGHKISHEKTVVFDVTRCDDEHRDLNDLNLV